MRRDPVLGAAIKAIGPCRMAERQRERSPDGARRRHRQPAAVARRPRRRSSAGSWRCFPTAPIPAPPPSPRIDERRLRGVGLSGQKVGYLRDLCARIADGRLRLDELDVARRRSGDRAADGGEGLRPVDGGDVPDVPPAPARRAAGRRPRHRQRRAAAVRAAQAARCRSGCRRSARPGGRTARWPAGTCGRRSSVESTARLRPATRRPLSLEPEQQEADRDRDQRAALAVERLAPGERRRRAPVERWPAAASSRQPARHRRRVVAVRCRRAAVEQPLLPPHDRVILEREQQRPRPARARAAGRSSANPTQSTMLPRYSGLRTRANGPVSMSGPSRSLRVREIDADVADAPEPQRLASDDDRHRRPGEQRRRRRRRRRGTSSRMATSGSGSEVRCRNSQPPSAHERCPDLLLRSRSSLRDGVRRAIASVAEYSRARPALL